jgi:P22 coat protein - gene protein 5
MPNTLTGLIPTLYESLNVVSREMVGFIPAVTRDANATRAAVNQTVRVPVAAVAAAQDVTPATTAPNAGDATIGFTDVTITKSRAVPIRWTGEEQRGFGTNGQLQTTLRDQFSEAMRTLVNEMEVDIFAVAKANSSRAVGTAGTTPFATSGVLDDVALLRQVLEDNGAPTTDLQFVGNSLTWANIRGKQAGLFRVNESGTEQLLRDGLMDRLQGFAMRNSAGISLHTKGTGASYVTSGVLAVGGTSSVLVTGTGTILPGDIVTYAADAANKYVVNTGVAAPGTIVLGKPGARVSIPTANALTVGNNYRGNFGFAKTAIVLVQRTPALPDGGDMADDRISITDPISGITFEIAVYRQYRQVYYEVAATWGVAAPNGAHIATLLG